MQLARGSLGIFGLLALRLHILPCCIFAIAAGQALARLTSRAPRSLLPLRPGGAQDFTIHSNNTMNWVFSSDSMAASRSAGALSNLNATHSEDAGYGSPLLVTLPKGKVVHLHSCEDCCPDLAEFDVGLVLLGQSPPYIDEISILKALEDALRMLIYPIDSGSSDGEHDAAMAVCLLSSVAPNETELNKLHRLIEEALVAVKSEYFMARRFRNVSVNIVHSALVSGQSWPECMIGVGGPLTGWSSRADSPLRSRLRPRRSRWARKVQRFSSDVAAGDVLACATAAKLASLSIRELSRQAATSGNETREELLSLIRWALAEARRRALLQMRGHNVGRIGRIFLQEVQRMSLEAIMPFFDQYLAISSRESVSLFNKSISLSEWIHHESYFDWLSAARKQSLKHFSDAVSAAARELSIDREPSGGLMRILNKVFRDRLGGGELAPSGLSPIEDSIVLLGPVLLAQKRLEMALDSLVEIQLAKNRLVGLLPHSNRLEFPKLAISINGVWRHPLGLRDLRTQYAPLSDNLEQRCEETLMYSPPLSPPRA